jgi:hypothetical protein
MDEFENNTSKETSEKNYTNMRSQINESRVKYAASEDVRRISEVLNTKYSEAFKKLAKR